MREAITFVTVIVLAIVVLIVVQPRFGHHNEGMSDVIARQLPTVVNIAVFRSDARDPDGPDAVNGHRHTIGSGIIVDPSGVIVTNAHVVSGNGVIRIALQDGRVFAGTIIGQDLDADIAVLRAGGASSLVPAVWGDSRRLRAGDPVLAIGNPLGLGGSVTAGIVSGVNRDARLGPRDEFIQTDAQINSGSSGGPLLNSAGEVVGINTALLPAMRDGGSVGISFAIPSWEARPIVDHLLKYGRAHPGWIGVKTQRMTSNLATALGIARAEGALVSSVASGGPAAGVLHPGDIVLGIGGTKVIDPRDLSASLADLAIGQATTVTLWRGRREMAVKVAVAPRPDADCSPNLNIAVGNTNKSQIDWGLTLGPLTDKDRLRLKLTPGQDGVLVRDVAPFSVAADERIMPDTIIEMVGSQHVGNPRQVHDLIQQAEKDGGGMLGILVQEQSGSHWAALPLQAPRTGAAPLQGQLAISVACRTGG